MNSTVEFKMLRTNRSQGWSRRLRHSLFHLSRYLDVNAIGGVMHGRDYVSRSVSSAPETRAQRRARAAEERRKANTEKVRLIRHQGRLDNKIVPTSTGSAQHLVASLSRALPSFDEDLVESFKGPRKITGAVRRGLQRAAKKKGAANVSVKDV